MSAEAKVAVAVRPPPGGIAVSIHGPSDRAHRRKVRAASGSPVNASLFMREAPFGRVGTSLLETAPPLKGGGAIYVTPRSAARPSIQPSTSDRSQATFARPIWICRGKSLQRTSL